MGETRKRLALAIVRHLQSELNEGLVTDAADSIQVAVDCLAASYELDLGNEAQFKELASEKTLMEMFLSGSGITAAEPEKAASISAEDKERAEKLKSRGNDFVKNNKFAEALDCYSKAIEIDPTEPVYLSNRAAVYSKMLNYQQSIDDCRKALELDPNFSKAYGRLGFAYMNMKELEKATTAYEQALQLDPDNQSYKTCLQVIRQKLASSAQEEPPNPNPASAATAPPPSSGSGGVSAGGFPDLGGMDIGAMFSNPAMMNMAQSLMSNPAVMNMATSMFSSLSGAGGQQGGGQQGAGQQGGGQQGGGGGLENLFAMGQQITQQLSQNNPELLEQLQEQMGGGQGSGGSDPSGSSEDK
eukprot:m.307469 g.307469  ORF g.307469 m.307469 type:complete len:357 (+) comp42319_c0_seq1:149-1219(+)